MYPNSLKNLKESLKYLPGIGGKTAERFAFSIMDLEEEKINLLINSIKDVRTKIHKCPICNSLTEDDICYICKDLSRNSNTLCIVEDVRNLFLIEDIGIYNGFYHVLDGLISPLDGVNPEDIDINKLLDRIKNNNFNEIILAFKPSVEGETTSLYINQILSGLNIKISRIASGIPIGADMEYIDAMTLERSFRDRKYLE